MCGSAYLLLVLGCAFLCVEMAMPMAGGGVMGLPNGFRFVPTDEELTIQYLYKKAFSLPLPNNIITVADLARIHPADLPGNEVHGDMFFFSRPVPRCGRRGHLGRRSLCSSRHGACPRP